jgi:hypothetical protein
MSLAVFFWDQPYQAFSNQFLCPVSPNILDRLVNQNNLAGRIGGNNPFSGGF